MDIDPQRKYAFLFVRVQEGEHYVIRPNAQIPEEIWKSNKGQKAIAYYQYKEIASKTYTKYSSRNKCAEMNAQFGQNIDISETSSPKYTTFEDVLESIFVVNRWYTHAEIHKALEEVSTAYAYGYGTLMKMLKSSKVLQYKQDETKPGKPYVFQLVR